MTKKGSMREPVAADSAFRRASAILTAAEDQLEQILDEAEETGPGETTSGTDHILDTFLAEVGRAVGEASRAWHGKREASTYFWPGYQRRTVKGLEAERVGSRELLAKGTGTAEGKAWEVDVNTVWFNKLLKKNSHCNPIEPGSTLKWLGQKELDSNFRLLAVERSTSHYEYGEKSICVDLSRNAFGQWGQAIHEEVEAYFRSLEDDTSSLHSWPFELSDEPVRTLQLAWYDCWLRACFDQEAVKSDDFLAPVERALEANENNVLTPDKRRTYLEHLKRERGSAVYGQFGKLGILEYYTRGYQDYQFWYSYVVPKRFQKFTEIEGHDYFAADMLLSSEPLPREFFDKVIDWCQKQYQILREIEDTYRNRERAGVASLASRVWPNQFRLQFKSHAAQAAGQPGQIPHQFNEAGLESFKPALLGYLTDLAGANVPEPKTDGQWAAVHGATKALAGYHASAHIGAGLNEDDLFLNILADQDWQAGRTPAIRTLNMGSLVLLLLAATPVTAAGWYKDFEWPDPQETLDFGFKEITPQQTHDQHFRTAIAILDFFEKIVVHHDGSTSGIEAVDLQTDSLRLQLKFGMSELSDRLWSENLQSTKKDGGGSMTFAFLNALKMMRLRTDGIEDRVQVLMKPRGDQNDACTLEFNWISPPQKQAEPESKTSHPRSEKMRIGLCNGTSQYHELIQRRFEEVDNFEYEQIEDIYSVELNEFTFVFFHPSAGGFDWPSLHPDSPNLILYSGGSLTFDEKAPRWAKKNIPNGDMTASDVQELLRWAARGYTGELPELLRPKNANADVPSEEIGIADLISDIEGRET